MSALLHLPSEDPVLDVLRDQRAALDATRVDVRAVPALQSRLLTIYGADVAEMPDAADRSRCAAIGAMMILRLLLCGSLAAACIIGLFSDALGPVGVVVLLAIALAWLGWMFISDRRASRAVDAGIDVAEARELVRWVDPSPDVRGSRPDLRLQMQRVLYPARRPRAPRTSSPQIVAQVLFALLLALLVNVTIFSADLDRASADGAVARTLADAQADLLVAERERAGRLRRVDSRIDALQEAARAAGYSRATGCPLEATACRDQRAALKKARSQRARLISPVTMNPQGARERAVVQRLSRARRDAARAEAGGRATRAEFDERVSELLRRTAGEPSTAAVSLLLLGFLLALALSVPIVRRAHVSEYELRRLQRRRLRQLIAGREEFLAKSNDGGRPIPREQGELDEHG